MKIMTDKTLENERGESEPGVPLEANYDPVFTLTGTVDPEIRRSSYYDEDPPSYETMYPASASSAADGEGNETDSSGIVLKPSKLASVNCNQVMPLETTKPEKVLQRKITLTKFNKETREKLLVQASGLTKGARETLRDFCQRTTAHGFSHVIEKDLHIVLRVFWVVVTFVSLGALLSVGYDATYAAFVTKRPYTEVTYRDNQSTGVRLPDITVCSLSGFWKSKIKKYNVSDALASYILLAVQGTEVISPVLKRDPKRLKLLISDLNDYLSANQLTLEELILLLSPDCEDVVKGCFSDSGDLYGTDCCKTILRPAVTTLGVCFTTLGQQQRLQQTIAGLVGGYRLLFDVNLHEYMDYDHNVVSTTSLAEAGIHVSLSNFASMPSVAANIQAIRIAPNTAASVALDVTNIDHTEVYLDDWLWKNPKPRCVSEKEFWGMSKIQQAYTGSNQYFTLLYRNCLNRIYNCSFIPFMFENDTTNACMPDTLVQQSIIHDEMLTCVQELLEAAGEGSGKLCFTTTINQQLSYTTIRSKTVQGIMNARQFPPNITPSMINIYYSELGFTEYYERIPTFSTWFSDLGGQMGLFMGASFITLVELLFTVCYVLRVLLTRALKSLLKRYRGEKM